MSEEHVGDATSAFFADLASQGRVPMLAALSGSLRFDLSGDGGVDHWYVRLDKGHVEVDRRNAKADAVIASDKSLFDGMVTGRVNAMTAVLRNVIRPEGDFGLLLSFQRLFPGPGQTLDTSTREAS
jgi:hypothetical protein